MKHTVDIQYYPGWTRKAVCFTIDDGNLEMDEKFLSIVRPAGIRGTFNLCGVSTEKMTAAEWRAFYAGYEIANHCKHHPFAFADGRAYDISPAPFAEGDPEDALYPTDVPHLYRIRLPRGWRMIADTEGYVRFADEAQKELRAVFGDMYDEGFVWPFDIQPNAAVLAHLCATHRSIRQSGADGDSRGFALPADRHHWHYTATHRDVAEMGARYADFPDDGTLKYFCVGVHSIDYERDGRWGDLRAFAARFGRNAAYCSLPIGEIFAHEDALRQVRVTDGAVENPSGRTVYLTVDGERATVAPHAALPL